MIADNFDPRTLANMEVALERACEILPAGAEQHDIRRQIASKILECAVAGETTLGGLTEAGLTAATELWAACCLIHLRKRSFRKLPAELGNCDIFSATASTSRTFFGAWQGTTIAPRSPQGFP